MPWNLGIVKGDLPCSHAFPSGLLATLFTDSFTGADLDQVNGAYWDRPLLIDGGGQRISSNKLDGAVGSGNLAVATRGGYQSIYLPTAIGSSPTTYDSDYGLAANVWEITATVDFPLAHRADSVGWVVEIGQFLFYSQINTGGGSMTVGVAMRSGPEGGVIYSGAITAYTFTMRYWYGSLTVEVGGLGSLALTCTRPTSRPVALSHGGVFGGIAGTGATFDDCTVKASTV